MNILFLTLARTTDINYRGIYADLMRKFRDEGHHVYIVSPNERRFKESTKYSEQDGIKILLVKTLNIQKINFIEKGIATLLIDYQYIKAINKYMGNVHFDLVMYSTPPITFTNTIITVKKKHKAKTYLLLKDIFPQNAVDLGMIKKGGIIHRYFRHKEKQLYRVSDTIGCMSSANVDYVIRHNPEISPNIVEVNPNSIEPDTEIISKEERTSIRKRFGIPQDITTFIYGGNLGKPQGIDFLLEVLYSNKEKQGVFVVVVGTGTEFLKVQNWFTNHHPANAILLSGLPKNEYDNLIQSCDVGLIFLDRRFTIPNFPSRLLSYLEYKMPVIAATDRNTDMGEMMENEKFGLWAENGDLIRMNENMENLAKNPYLRLSMGRNGFHYLLNNYTVSHSYKLIIKHYN